MFFLIQVFVEIGILDLFSRKVVAHGVSKNNSTYLVTSTFKKAFEARNYPSVLV
jgi:transposase InsO family protein